MINVERFLSNNNICETYALVTYNNSIHPVWFTRHNNLGQYWFLESPCELRRITEVKESIDDFCREYTEGLLEEGEDINDYINKYVKPMIINGILYEIDNFQCVPYLPKSVDDIKLN